MKKTTALFLFLFSVLSCFTQSTGPYGREELDELLEYYDFSSFFVAERLLVSDNEGNSEQIEKPEILGFIGDDYQRFQIHIVSMIKNPEKRTEYMVYGKTNKSGNISDFQGTMRIVSSGVQSYDSAFVHGFAEFEVTFYEAESEKLTGTYRGKLKTNFLIEKALKRKKEKFRYDGSGFYSDGFCNNQFVGTWNSYNLNGAKKCHWGDFRIPECGDLDIGAGEFSVSDKYVKNGWENYMLLLNSGDDAEKRKKALANEKWW